MPLKNKYGTLRVGVERGYYEHKNCKDSMDIDFIATKLFYEKEMKQKIKDMEQFLKENKINSYKVKPIFGHKMEDTNIWESNIYGILSEWIDADNENLKYAEYSTDALQKELEWANYIFVSNLIINCPRLKCDNYARTINSYLKENNCMSITLRVPTFTYLEQTENKQRGYPGRKKHKHVTETNGTSVYREGEWYMEQQIHNDMMQLKSEKQGEKWNEENRNEKLISGWELWKRFGSYINFNFTNIQAAIELTNPTKSELNSINLDIWKAEPVKLIIIPLDAFVVDAQGYPYLPKKYKDLLIFFFRKNIEVLITNTIPSHQISKQTETQMQQTNTASHLLQKTVENKTFLNCCIYYIKRLFSSIENFDNEKLFDSYYWDYLQIPLQPLKDNLQSQTYEDFEKDQTKYEKYELAIYKYLNDEIQKQPNKRFVIFVVGAGRGPLVDSAMSALKKNEIESFHIYAIEKNKSAVMVLQNRLREEKWKRHVTIIQSDMRYLKNVERADLIVSELLGSFGDNELFPECLDGAQKYLKPSGKSIPQNCLSYLEPICCSDVYYKILQNKFEGNTQIFYVINTYSYCPVSVEGAKRCFYFEMPNRKFEHYRDVAESDETEKGSTFVEEAGAEIQNVPINGCDDTRNGNEVGKNTSDNVNTAEVEMSIEEHENIENDIISNNLHNKRYREISFNVKTDSLLHGFLCYFKSQLYKDVYLSTEPNSQTPQLRSWYPLLMPLNRVIPLRKNDTVSISVWRLTDQYRVWFEWCLNEPVPTNVHNANGKHFFIGK